MLSIVIGGGLLWFGLVRLNSVSALAANGGRHLGILEHKYCGSDGDANVGDVDRLVFKQVKVSVLCRVVSQVWLQLHRALVLSNRLAPPLLCGIVA